MKYRSCLTILLCILFTGSVFSQSIEKTVGGNNAFAFELFKNVFEKESNVFLSPFSISSALAMTYAGARNETEKQMSKVLHFDLNQKNIHQGFFEINSELKKYKSNSEIELSIANAIWKREGSSFKKDFLDINKKYYSTDLFPLKGAKPINEWAAKNTRNKITEIVTEGDLSDATMVLTNAIYFKGDWLNSFNEKETQKSKFKTANGKEIDIDMMFQVNQVNYFEDENNQVIDLPYKGETMSMTIILPKETNSISKLSAALSVKLFTSYIKSLEEQEVNIYLPKFSFESEFHLENVLSIMGMPDAFNPGKADFTGMANGVFIGGIIHKAVIEVNEKGSVAAAVTAVVIRETSAVKQDIFFNADHPFVIVIREKKTGSILFMGSVIEPKIY